MALHTRAFLVALLLQAPVASGGAAPPQGISQSSARRIGAVVDTLQDLLASIESEEAQEKQNFKCLMKWCDGTSASLAEQIEASASSYENNQVAAKQHVATIATLEHTIDDAVNEVEEVTDAIAQANSIREQDNAKYMEERSLNMQSASQIANAIRIVGQVRGAGGFLQGGMVQRVQLNEPGESSYVLGIMKQLKINLETNMASAEKAETEKATIHATMMSTKQKQLKALQEFSSQKRTEMTEERVELANADAAMRREESKLASLKETQAGTTKHCDTKRQEWDVRTEERVQEKAAISEAISYLTLTITEHQDASREGGASFLQLGLVSSLSSGSGALGAAEALVAAANGDLAELSRRDVPGDQRALFAKLKKIIASLVSVLQEDQREETEKRAYCVAERKQKELEQADTTDLVETLNATIAHKDSLVETLTTESQQINATLQGSAKRLAAAAKLRKDELAVYEAGSKDRKLGIKVLREAKQVLKRFYDSREGASRSMVQVARTTGKNPEENAPPETWASGSSTRHGGEGNIVLNMLDGIRDDIAKEQKEAEVIEQESASAFLELQRETRRAFDEGMREITLRVTEKARTKVQLDDHREVRQAKQESLQGLSDQLVGLAQECGSLVQNFEARRKARDFEIAQLRDVVDILAGSAIAARTALVQTSNSVPTAAEVAAFDDMSRAIDGLEAKAKKMLQ